MADNSPVESNSINNNKAMANIQAEMAKRAAELSSNLSTPNSNIGVAGKQFKLPDGTVLGSQMDVVVLGHIKVHEMYGNEPYNPNKPTPPLCWARNKLGDEEAPHSQVEKPECATCAECPNNQWGSAGNGKACKEKFRVAVVLPGVDKSKVYNLNIASTGMTAFDGAIKVIQKGFGQGGNLAMPFAATVQAEFTDAAYPVVKLTGTNATANSDEDVARYFSMYEDAIDDML